MNAAASFSLFPVSIALHHFITQIKAAHLNRTSCKAINASIVPNQVADELYSIIARLTAELEVEKKLRQSERTSRISLQQRAREDKIQRGISDGFVFSPIGSISSPFKDRRGTPRQPVLVPAAKGRINFNKKIIQAAHFQEIEQFSHIWVIPLLFFLIFLTLFRIIL